MEKENNKLETDAPASDWSDLLAVVKATAFVLFLLTWLDADESIDDLPQDVLLRLKNKWQDYWIPSLSQPHRGDCTKVCAPCTRCSMESLIKTAKKIVNIQRQANLIAVG